MRQKIIVTESEKIRIKGLYGIKTITEQAAEGEQQGMDTWSLCGYNIVSLNGSYFVMAGENEYIEIPSLGDIKGVIQNGELVFDEKIQNGLDVGFQMKKSIGCRNSFPMQYAGATVRGNGGGWFVYIENGDNGPIPVYSIMTWDGSLGTGSNSPYLEVKKDKDGTEVIYRKVRTKRFIIEISPAMRGSKNVPYTPPPPVKTPEYEEIKLDIQSPFEFDKVTLTPDAEVEFKAFVEKVKANYQGVSGNVEVICSASIDADENAKRDYNQRLSENRANTIANRLKMETGITTLNFTPKGIGQTDQFAKGMKYPEVRDVSKTAPNRRLIVKMPPITREKK